MSQFLYLFKCTFLHVNLLLCSLFYVACYSLFKMRVINKHTRNEIYSIMPCRVDWVRHANCCICTLSGVNVTSCGTAVTNTWKTFFFQKHETTLLNDVFVLKKRSMRKPTEKFLLRQLMHVHTLFILIFFCYAWSPDDFFNISDSSLLLLVRLAREQFFEL